MLVTSIFSFSHSVFYSIKELATFTLYVCKCLRSSKNLLFGKTSCKSSPGNIFNLQKSKLSSFGRVNPLLHRQLLKTVWEKKKLLVTSNFFFPHNVLYSIRKLYPHLSIFLTPHLYLLLNWKSPKLACEVRG